MSSEQPQRSAFAGNLGGLMERAEIGDAKELTRRLGFDETFPGCFASCTHADTRPDDPVWLEHFLQAILRQPLGETLPFGDAGDAVMFIQSIVRCMPDDLRDEAQISLNLAWAVDCVASNLTPS